MDFLGSISIVFEISWLLGTMASEMGGGESEVDAVFLRAARAAKIGARAGRLTKVLKCIAVLTKKADIDDNEATVRAQAIYRRLNLSLTSQVSMLAITLVLATPMFSFPLYPETDLSMSAWGERLESEYARAYEYLKDKPTKNTTDLFAKSVLKLDAFYQARNYYPYAIQGFDTDLKINGRAVTIPGAHLLESVEPVRKQNIMRVPIKSCDVERPRCSSGATPTIDFDFTQPNRMEAIMFIALIAFMVTVMIIVSCLLSSTLDTLMVRPIERLMGVMTGMASEVVVKLDTRENNNDVDSLTGKEDEFQFLEKVLRKLARLADLAMQRHVVSADEVEGMNIESKGVIVEIMAMDNTPGPFRVSDMRTTSEERKRAQPSVLVEDMPVTNDVVESWDLNVLDFDTVGLGKIVTYIFFDSTVSFSCGQRWCDAMTLKIFNNEVFKRYNDLPYHCYAHAIDVLHTVFQLLSNTQSSEWLGDVDEYAVLIAALCHDLGHAGKTNPFLVETRHEWALRYNDKSPLENMHCSSLFDICKSPEADVFKNLDRDGYKQARKVCVATILHTDNANHFEMVKDVGKAYELSSELCEEQARSESLTDAYRTGVLERDTILWLELFLHFSDISNPLKAFKMCEAWAWRVLDEFFAQGDEEKRLGLPVGMLNDREKINRPGSQHGFINFLVAPLVFTTVRLFPVLYTRSSQMAQNLRTWKDKWVDDAKPSLEDISKRDGEVGKIEATAAELAARVSFESYASVRKI
eukprot:TRINITY_DN9703_c0_g1_i1.p1 TRINITY_DN9703_c0_g1~~TRINITY_DN9703_c0_g1_i1.p1  ORF type:complete len:809 (+),score=106.35 TRINITY_DN9703_c0_g1_i1:175-2427(+)